MIGSFVPFSSYSRKIDLARLQKQRHATKWSETLIEDLLLEDVRRSHSSAQL